MTLRFTPDTLRAAYEFLRTTPPFCRWKLPAAEQFIFQVGKSSTTHADYSIDTDGRRYIRVSEKLVGHTHSLLESVAHEMVHLRQEQLGYRPPFSHGAVFQKLTAQVCKHHGFDPKAF